MQFFDSPFLCVLFLQLEKQIHEDEEFARTLAMLDEAPLAKKVCTSLSLSVYARKCLSVYLYVCVCVCLCDSASDVLTLGS